MLSSDELEDEDEWLVYIHPVLIGLIQSDVNFLSLKNSFYVKEGIQDITFCYIVGSMIVFRL